MDDAEVADRAQIAHNVARLGHAGGDATGVEIDLPGGNRRSGGQAGGFGGGGCHLANHLFRFEQVGHQRGVEADFIQQGGIEATLPQVVGHAVKGGVAVAGHGPPGQLEGDVTVDGQGFVQLLEGVRAVVLFPEEIDDGRVVFQPVAGQLKDAFFADGLFEPLHLAGGPAVHQIVGVMERIVVPINQNQRGQRRGDGQPPNVAGRDAGLNHHRPDEATGGLPIVGGVMLRPARLFVDEGVLFKGKAAHLSFSVNDAGFRAAGSVIKP